MNFSEFFMSTNVYQHNKGNGVNNLKGKYRSNNKQHWKSIPYFWFSRQKWESNNIRGNPSPSPAQYLQVAQAQWLEIIIIFMTGMQLGGQLASMQLSARLCFLNILKPSLFFIKLIKGRQEQENSNIIICSLSFSRSER